MTVDQTGIYNLALDAIGARARVSSPSERSREAEACNLWFEAIRDQILASARWPEATKTRRLAQLTLQEDDEWVAGEPRPGYTYVYGLPSDCLRPQYLTNFAAFDIQHHDAENTGLHTNQHAPILVYTFRQELIARWSAELQMAVVFGLAANICVPLTGKPSRAKLLMQQANEHIIAARESAANMNNETYEAVPDWIAARGYSGTFGDSRFIYPQGSLLTSASGIS